MLIVRRDPIDEEFDMDIGNPCGHHLNLVEQQMMVEYGRWRLTIEDRKDDRIYFEYARVFRSIWIHLIEMSRVIDLCSYVR